MSEILIKYRIPALHQAALIGNIYLLENLLENGVDVNHQDCKGGSCCDKNNETNLK